MTTAKNETTDEAYIRQMIEGFVEAFRAKELTDAIVKAFGIEKHRRENFDGRIH